MPKRRIMQTKLSYTTAQYPSFPTPEMCSKFEQNHPQRERQMEVGYVRIDDF